MKNSLFGKDIISVESLRREEVEHIFEKTREMEVLVKEKGGDGRLKGKVIAALFFEPSTRTFSSFITAMQRLGGGIIPLNGMQNTSVEKGESFEHTIQVFSRYADCLVIRHPEPGKPQIASDYSPVPVINAGDGINEHPTQGLFDTYTIYQHFKSLNNLTITMVGDLKNGRTVHSLSQVIAKMGKNINFNFISPGVLQMPQNIKNKINKSGIKYKEIDDLKNVISESDVVYMTRVQKERFTDLDEYERLKSSYILSKSMISSAKKDMIIMHPLPIAAGEINNDLDANPHSLYLNVELSNGLYLRMALLDLILRKQ